MCVFEKVKNFEGIVCGKMMVDGGVSVCCQEKVTCRYFERGFRTLGETDV